MADVRVAAIDEDGVVEGAHDGIISEGRAAEEKQYCIIAKGQAANKELDEVPNSKSP